MCRCWPGCTTAEGLCCHRLHGRAGERGSDPGPAGGIYLSEPPPVAAAARPSILSKVEIAPASRSCVADSGKGIDRTGRLVRTSRVNSPASVSPAPEPEAIDSRNLTPASISEAAALATPLPPAATELDGSC